MHYRTKKRVGKYIGIILAVVILSYTAFETRGIVSGPRMHIETPQNGATVAVGLVSLRGTVARVSSIQVNGSELFTDLKGHFTKDILLSPGYNVIEVKAQDSFGRTVEKKIELVAVNPKVGTPVALESVSKN